MPSRLLLPYEVIDKEYSVGVPLSQPHIEEDEFIVYKRLGLAGDGYSAAALIMAYYRFGSHDDEKKAGYLRNIWAYISSKFGYKGSEGVLKFHWKDSIEIYLILKKGSIKPHSYHIFLRSLLGTPCPVFY